MSVGSVLRREFKFLILLKTLEESLNFLFLAADIMYHIRFTTLFIAKNLTVSQNYSATLNKCLVSKKDAKQNSWLVCSV